MHVFQRMLYSKHSYGAVAVLCKEAVNLYIRYRTIGALVGIKRNKVVVACALKIAEYAIVAVAVKMYAVHICRARITVIEIKCDILKSEIGYSVKSCGICDGVFYSQI